MRRALFILAALLTAGIAHADDLAVSVRDRAGAPVVNAVATFRPAAGVAAGSPRFDWPMRMSQRGVAFDPHVLIVPVGAEVSFPNFDNVRHHVYSFSAGNRFELRLFSRDETRSYRFTAPGVAAIGCNIHDKMSAFIVVVDTPYAAKTGPDGRLLLRGASGAGVLTIWHPDLRAPGNKMTRTIQANRTGAGEALVVDLRSTAGAHH
ncbi:MAG: methylamine utilization protein [Hyphomonadaceae bacterium]|nr:methylamine utilization protein [Hyphomonadaceae bacterium]